MSYNNGNKKVNTNSTERSSKASPAQLNTVISYIEQHPELAWKEFRKDDTRYDKIKRLWNRLSKILNSIEGSRKTTSGWMKFWQDKRRLVVIKSRQIKQGKIQKTLSSVEHRIMKLYLLRCRVLKSEACNGDKNSYDDNDDDANTCDGVPNTAEMISNDFEEKSFNLMGTMVEAMGKQALSLSQIAQESLKKSAAMTQIADSCYRQALAIDNLVTIFDGFSGSLYDVRNAIMSIGYTMKRCYPPDSHRDNSNNILFS